MKFTKQYNTKKEKGKQVAFYIGKLLFLLLILWLVFHKNYVLIYANIRKMKGGSFLLLLLLGTLYELLEATAFYVLIGKEQTDFKWRHAVSNVYLGVFGNVAAFTVGSIPLRLYYLHRKGIGTGKAISLMNGNYILHKSAVLLCNTAFLLASGGTVFRRKGDLLRHVLFGYGICFCIIAGLFCVGFSNRIYEKLRGLLLRLPATEKWNPMKEKVLYHLTLMHESGEDLKENKRRVGYVMCIHCVKLFVLYSVPFLCMKKLCGSTISFLEAEMLVGLTHLLANALPNISGIGGTEVAFLLVFAGYFERGTTSSILVLYRFATYFFPFLVSVLIFERTVQ